MAAKIGFLVRAIRGIIILGVVISVAVVLLMLGANVFFYFQDGPWPTRQQAQAAMAGDANVDLANASEHLDDLIAVLGPPEHMQVSKDQNNLSYYRWRRDAVNAAVLDNVPIRIQIGDTGLLRVLPLDRPTFPGMFLGLRIGDPVPSPAAAAAVRKQAVDCCDAEYLNWGVKDGRISSIDYQRQVLVAKFPKPPGT